jgi:hypothetical protein
VRIQKRIIRKSLNKTSFLVSVQLMSVLKTKLYHKHKPTAASITMISILMRN